MTKATSLTDHEVAAFAQQLQIDIAGDEPSTICLEAPRRRHGDGTNASAIAEVMYPNLSPLQAIIQYEAAIVALRKIVVPRSHAEEEARRDAKGRTHREMVKRQGPWNPPDAFWSPNAEDETGECGFVGGRKGVPALPMPVEVAKPETLAHFFNFLGSNDTPNFKADIQFFSKPKDDAVIDYKHGSEPYYGVDMIEFNKGVLYADQRMDLCKMVVGPNNIKALLNSLEKSDHVKHFLLGNNIIGPMGSRAIAQFIRRQSNKIETWYLAGNMINAAGIAEIAEAAAETESPFHSLWLKRNPLGLSSIDSLFKLITQCPKLRVLDLDQTELSDAGISKLFDALSTKTESVPLETIYLNGNGVSEAACASIAKFLQCAACKLQNLYLSGNPIGDRGLIALSAGLKNDNQTLKRLSITSSGITSTGAVFLADVLVSHPCILSIDLGQAITTKDLGGKYNWITDDSVDAFGRLLQESHSLRYLNLGTAALTLKGLDRLREYVSESRLVYFQAHSCFHREPQCSKMHNRLKQNVKEEYGISMEEFFNAPLRWLRSPEDVRFTDSVYRNRDAQLARRKLKVLKKDWNIDDETMKEVLQYNDEFDGSESDRSYDAMQWD